MTNFEWNFHNRGKSDDLAQELVRAHCLIKNGYQTHASSPCILYQPPAEPPSPLPPAPRQRIGRFVHSSGFNVAGRGGFSFRRFRLTADPHALRGIPREKPGSGPRKGSYLKIRNPV